MERLLKSSLLFGEAAEKFYLEKIPSKEKTISKCKKKVSFFKKTIDEKEINPKKKWFKKFENYWNPSEENALLELKKFIENTITKYSDTRNFPYLRGTSKLSPFIKHGQIHVETIWEECNKVKSFGTNKFLAEIGWREFNHSLINFFLICLKKIILKNLISFHGKKI